MVESLFENSLQPSNASGIYAIINRNNLKIYIGSAVCLATRRRLHKGDIRRRNHHSKYLQKAALKEPEAFEFSVVETVSDKSKLIAREQFWINFYKSYLPKNGYNLCPVAGSRLGYRGGPMSPAHRLAISISNKGKPPTMKGRKHTDSTKRKISAANKGRQHTLGRVRPESERQHLSKLFKGRIFTPEWKAKISKAKKGIAPLPHVIAASVAARKIKAARRHV
jgi:group I intron endonuclease